MGPTLGTRHSVGNGSEASCMMRAWQKRTPC